MRIDIITVLPEMLESFFNCSIMSRAQKKGIAEIHIHNLRDYAYDRYRKVYFLRFIPQKADFQNIFFCGL